MHIHNKLKFCKIRNRQALKNITHQVAFQKIYFLKLQKFNVDIFPSSGADLTHPVTFLGKKLRRRVFQTLHSECFLY